MGHSKSNEIRLKLFYFRQSVLNKNFGSRRFKLYTGDSKSESWHRAKKIRKVFMNY